MSELSNAEERPSLSKPSNQRSSGKRVLCLPTWRLSRPSCWANAAQTRYAVNDGSNFVESAPLQQAVYNYTDNDADLDP